jgi:class 3 adenylate cyclase
MVYQFVGDQVIGLFGIPDRPKDYLKCALETAKALRSIGSSISNHWQRHIDRIQQSAGLHLGMALGDLQVVALRPFSRTHMGAVGDPVDIAVRLLAHAGPGEIAASNAFYQSLPDEAKTVFAETTPVEAPSFGHIRAWRLAAETS